MLKLVLFTSATRVVNRASRVFRSSPTSLALPTSPRMRYPRREDRAAHACRLRAVRTSHARVVSTSRSRAIRTSHSCAVRALQHAPPAPPLCAARASGTRMAMPSRTRRAHRQYRATRDSCLRAARACRSHAAALSKRRRSLLPFTRCACPHEHVARALENAPRALPVRARFTYSRATRPLEHVVRAVENTPHALLVRRMRDVRAPSIARHWRPLAHSARGVRLLLVTVLRLRGACHCAAHIMLQRWHSLVPCRKHAQDAH